MREYLDRDAERHPDPIDHLDRVAASGSCARCGRALGLASAKVGGRWYGNSACASGGACPLEESAPIVAESALFGRPRRFFRRRRPRELRSNS
jgi:hypothetical protein